MGCDPERVTAYVDGELTRALAGETRRHLSTCPACSAQAKFETDLGYCLRSLPDPLTRGWLTHGLAETGAGSAFNSQDAVPTAEAVMGSRRVRGVRKPDAVVHEELVEVPASPAGH
jgi:hypothetical protein